MCTFHHIAHSFFRVLFLYISTLGYYLDEQVPAMDVVDEGKRNNCM